ncbi:MAG: ADYC domain-containing protein, partial [Kofleriaceae bacterium]
LLPVLLLAGCALDEPTFSDVEQFAKKQPGDCPTYGCGTNSPELDGHVAVEIHELGAVTPDDLRLVDFGRMEGTTWTSYRPDVLYGQLYARHKQTNAVILKDAQLAGTKFIIEHARTAERFVITVVRVEETPMWAQAPYAGRYSRSYELAYTSDLDPKRRNVCARPLGADPMGADMAVLFDADRISRDDLAVYAEEKDYFTIGCAGSALAKMHLTGHTKAGSSIIGRTSTLDERTAFLKMLSADYCGTGESYTVAGTRLHYRDRYGYMDTAQVGEVIEAMWGPRGAICTNTPRVEFSPSIASDKVFGADIQQELADFGCVLPRPCDPKTFEGLKHPYDVAYVMSTNHY